LNCDQGEWIYFKMQIMILIQRLQTRI
jgi:hypothetical protein